MHVKLYLIPQHQQKSGEPHHSTKETKRMQASRPKKLSHTLQLVCFLQILEDKIESALFQPLFTVYQPALVLTLRFYYTAV